METKPLKKTNRKEVGKNREWLTFSLQKCQRTKSRMPYLYYIRDTNTIQMFYIWKYKSTFTTWMPSV